MKMLTYRITTLGCRVNYAESRDLAAILQSRGLQPAGPAEPAQLEVVHSCTVTQTAAAKSRNAIRRAGRRLQNPSSGSIGIQPHVVVTGCFASSHPDDAAELVGSDDRVIQQSHRDGSTMAERFARQIDHWLAGEQDRQGVSTDQSIRESGHECSPNNSNAPRPALPLPVIETQPGTGSHVRAELRIQDGCDAHCTFCIIPKLRRTLRSKTSADAAREATMLVDAGHKEIVLTGIFIGAYGHETALRRKQRNRHAAPLAELIDRVAQVPGLQRLRISSMEPGDVDEPLIDAMVANQPVVVPHLHLPLQSGSDAVLRRMNRQYTVGEYLDMIDMVQDRLSIDDQPDRDPLPPAITTDIICGFPGETTADFQQTVDVARSVGYLHMHVFPYSARAGTAAARWRDAFVPVPTRRQRVQQLIDLERDECDGLALRFHQQLIGRHVRIIVEQPDRSKQGFMTGRCDHYALVRVPTDARRGTMLSVQIDSVSNTVLNGQPIQTGVALPVLSAASA